MFDYPKIKNCVTTHSTPNSDCFLTDCENGDVYRINETSYKIISYLDGAHMAEDIWRELTGSGKDASLSVGDVEQFVKELKSMGLLE